MEKLNEMILFIAGLNLGMSIQAFIFQNFFGATISLIGFIIPGLIYLKIIEK